VRWTSIVAIYVIVWVLSALIVLPFGVKTHEEAGIDKIPGQAESAPAHFRPGRIVLRATILSAIVTALFVANYVFGWISADDLNFFGKPPQSAGIESGN
jgi:predicted secreted protein